MSSERSLQARNARRVRPLRRLGRMNLSIACLLVAFGTALLSRFYVESAAPQVLEWMSAGDGEPQSGSAGGGWGDDVAWLQRASRWVLRTSPSSAPLDGRSPVASLTWFDDKGAVAIGSARTPPVAAAPDGNIVAERQPSRLVAAANPDGTTEALGPAIVALSRRTADDGLLYTRTSKTDVLTPGGLAAVLKDGSFVVTGGSEARQVDGGGRRFIAAKPDPQGLWLVQPWTSSPGLAIELQLSPERQGDVTALAAFPGYSLEPRRTGAVIVGMSTGFVRIVSVIPTNSDFQPSGDKLPFVLSRGHEVPVVALAATAEPDRVSDGAAWVSAAEDLSIKAWYTGGSLRAQSLDSRTIDIALPGDPPAFVLSPDSLELSPYGETLLVRAPTGTLYVARLVDDHVRGVIGRRIPDPAAGTVGAPQIQAGTQTPASARRPSYSVQIVVSPDPSGDPAARRAKLSDLSREIVRLPGDVTPVFASDAFDRADQAIAEGRSGVIQFAENVDAASATALDAIGSTFLSILPNPIRLRAVPLALPATAATLSADGKRLFAAGADCLIRELDLSALLAPLSGDDATAPVVSLLRGHGGPAIHLALSPGETHLAAASLDGRVRIHRLDRARLLAALPLSDLPTGPACEPTRPISLAIAVANYGRGVSSTSEALEIGNPADNSQYKVFIQFAGVIDRNQMIQLAQSLGGSGWNVQGGDRGGERTPNAAGFNEVRFGSAADREAAERIADQVSATLNVPAKRALSAKQVGSIAAGNLELWISR